MKKWKNMRNSQQALSQPTGLSIDNLETLLVIELSGSLSTHLFLAPGG
jgi:hypothetical protein